MSTRTTARRGIAAAPLAAVAAIGLSAGMAAAAVLSSLGVEGNVSRGQFLAEWASGTSYAPAAQVLDYDPATGTMGAKTADLPAPTVDASRKTLALGAPAEVFYGETLYVGGGAALKSGTTKSGYVSGITAKGTVPAGWQVRLASGCGAAVTPSMPANVGITVAPTAETGPAIDLKALGLSVVVSAGTKPAGHTCPIIPAP